MGRLKYIFTIIILANLFTINGQDVHFSQYYANPLYLASSMAGSSGESRVALQYRNQWANMPGQFVSYAFGGDHFFKKFKSGVGLRFIQETAGSAGFANTQMAFNYAFITQINREWTIRPGLGVSYFQRSFDINKMVFGDQLYGNDNTQSLSIGRFGNVNNVDFEASVMVNSDRVWFGINVDHLARPNISFTHSDYRLPIKYSVFMGYRYTFSDAYKKERFTHSISFVGNYYLQGESDQLDIGMSWKYKRFLAGFWYRGLPSFKVNSFSDAVILMAGFEFDKFRMAYSYDLTISKLGPSTGGSHELAISYSFMLKARKEVKAVPCPTF